MASLGRLVIAPSVAAAPRADLEQALHDYPLAHFSVARAILPEIRKRGGGYVMINGPLAFDPTIAGAGLVSIATAAQAMLARVLMREEAKTPVRINELVIYTRFGNGEGHENASSGAEIGRRVAHLLSDDGAAIRGETIHLNSSEVHSEARTAS